METKKIGENKMENLCDGCRTDNIDQCPVKATNDVYLYKNKCPCTNCLVKVICKKGCLEFTNHVIIIRKTRLKEEELRI